jgi:MinD-like ATPase involved in chromosome partitioning or flagellar assembly
VSVPVLTAVTDAVWEAELVAAFERRDYGVSVVRRCVDLADLLAVAGVGTARAAILSADLRRLDRDALVRLELAGVAVVGLFGADDADAERRLRQLGVAQLLRADAGPDAIAAAVTAAIAAVGDGVARYAYAEPRAALPDAHPLGGDGGRDIGGAAAVARGRVVAVWGPTGAPGRTTVAVTLATEAARKGCDTLLADADCYGGVVAQVLGLLDEAPGLAAGVRQANAGTLDLFALAKLARVVAPNLRVLTGIARADRWPELRPSGLTAVYSLARTLAALTVVDCGFALEQDEELSYDTVAPRRNGATLATLADADEVIAVGSADPVGIQRLVRGLAELREVIPGCTPVVVVNRLRKGPVHGAAEREISQALARHAGVDDVVFVPFDLAGFDRAIAAGRAIGEVAPDSPACQAIAGLASRVTGAYAGPPGRRRRARRPRSRQ